VNNIWLFPALGSGTDVTICATISQIGLLHTNSPATRMPDVSKPSPHSCFLVQEPGVLLLILALDIPLIRRVLTKAKGQINNQGYTAMRSPYI
jgi:hypothetical protein